MHQPVNVDFMCQDCTTDTLELSEYYAVTDGVWAATGFGSDDGMLCVGCLEHRLGRKLSAADFPNYPINRGVFPMSARLMHRVTHG